MSEQEKSVVGYVGARVSLKQFKRLIANCTPEQRRAMKSFYYSSPAKYEPEVKKQGIL